MQGIATIPPKKPKERPDAWAEEHAKGSMRGRSQSPVFIPRQAQSAKEGRCGRSE